MSRWIVAGSRDFYDYDVLNRVLEQYLREENVDDIEIVSGTAKGADTLGERFAKEHGIKCSRFPADWNKYGRSAGPIRNTEMAAYASKQNGSLFAFWDGESRGTKNMIDLARKYNLDVHIHYTY